MVRSKVIVTSALSMALGLGCSPPIPVSSLRTLSLPAPSDAAVCVPRGEGEVLLAVGPDGAAWTFQGGALGTVSRAGERASVLPLDAAPTALVVHPDGTFTLLTRATFETIAPDHTTVFALPSELGTPRAFCGSSADGDTWLAATDRGWVRRRAGFYFSLSVDGASLETADPIALPSGSCSSGAAALWLPIEGGVERLDLDARSLTADPLDVATGFSTSGAQYAFANEREVWLRHPDRVSRLALSEGTPRATALTDDALFILAEAGLLRVSLERGLVSGELLYASAQGEQLLAEPTGGAWVASATELCHVSPAVGLEITGIADDERLGVSRTLSIHASAAVDHLEVRLDGATLAASSEALEVALPQPTPGWHRLEMLASRGAETHRRTLDFEGVDTDPVSFAGEILPLVEAHCADCHDGEGRRAKLVDYDEFREFGPLVLTRLAAGEMPPRPRAPAPPEMARLVERWLRGGMLP